MEKKKTSNSYIGIDLDGTVAEYKSWLGLDHIGGPIVDIIEKVKVLVATGVTVKIFTARVSQATESDNQHAREVIWTWLEKNGLPKLEITNEKDYSMCQCWDDRARQVIPNSGVFVDELLMSMLQPLDKADLVVVASQAKVLENSPDPTMSAIGKTIHNCLNALDLAKKATGL